jgi:hypothetical protein
MRRQLYNGRRHNLLTSFLLAMLVFRAYVPVGFMPASGTPFELQICPVGLPAQLAHHLHHHSDLHDHFEHCPFGSAPAAGPISNLIGYEPAGQIVFQSMVGFEFLRHGVRLRRAHQSRGPPSLA